MVNAATPKRPNPDCLYPTIFNIYCVYSNVHIISSCESSSTSVLTIKFVTSLAFKNWLSRWAMTATIITMLMLLKTLASGE